MSAKSIAIAPPGRKILAWGKERSDAAPGHASQNTSSPEGAKEGGAKQAGVGRTIGDLIEPRREKAIPSEHPDLPYIGLEHIESHSTRLLGSVPATQMRSTAKRFYSGDVLYSRLRPYLNKVWHADRDGLCSSEFIVLPGNDAVDANFLRYRLNSSDFVRFANSLNAGDRPRVDFDQISSFILPPFSLPAQRAAVAEIEKQFTRLDAGVAALRRVQAKLKRYRAAVLKAACEGRLVPGNLKSWRKITLGEVVISMKNGIYKPRDSYADDGIACLRMYNIETGKIVWKDIKRMRLSREEIQEYGLLPGDLLVNRVNSRELVGKAAAIPVGLEECVFESKNIRVRLRTEQAEPRFVNFALSANGSAYFNRNAQQVVGMASISQPQVAGFPLAIPPLAEQTRIVAEVERRLSVVEECEAVVSANLQRATRLRQSILQRAFCGKLLSNDQRADKTNG
jgi:type I restriction enzyme S subunit